MENKRTCKATEVISKTHIDSMFCLDASAVTSPLLNKNVELSRWQKMKKDLFSKVCRKN